MIMQHGAKAIIGMDFPFGVAAGLKLGGTWEEVVRKIRNYPTALAFKDDCFTWGGDRELRRVTDREANTPFSPTNLRLYRQTYHGISDLIFPLLGGADACFVPLQVPIVGKPCVVEICPASTLKRENCIFQHFKNGSPAAAANRKTLLDVVIDRSKFRIANPKVIEALVVNNCGGDALDSIIAAWAVHNNLEMIVSGNLVSSLEGYIYC
jgi:hypothetical protein